MTGSFRQKFKQRLTRFSQVIFQPSTDEGSQSHAARPVESTPSPRKSPSVDETSRSHLSRIASAAESSTSINDIPHTATTDGAEPEDLWKRAEEILRKDKRKAKYLQRYYKILQSELGSGHKLGENIDRHAQLPGLLNARIEGLKMQMKLQPDEYESGFKSLGASIFKNILVAKDFINTAASASPPAVIACAGVTVFLTFAIQAIEQHSALLNGMDYISGLICRLYVIETVYRQRARIPCLEYERHSVQLDFQEMFEKELTSIYSKILEFQARALCYLRKKKPVQVLSDGAKLDAWDELLSAIKSSEDSIGKFREIIDGEKLQKGLERLHKMQKERENLQKRDETVTRFLKTLYTSPYKDRKDRNKERVPGTCKWFIGHSLYGNWIGSETSSLLWVSADPGCGKSVLARYLVDKVLPGTPNRTVCYFFFKDDFEDQKSSANALCALLRQIFLDKPGLLKDVVLNKFETDGDKLTQSFQELWAILTNVAADSSAGEIVCVLDALDECRDRDRSQLINVLRKFYSTKSGEHKLKFLLTSRPYGHIKREFSELERSLPTIHLSGEGESEVEDISREIDLVIENRVENIAASRGLEPDERKFLRDTITAATTNRTYLWVALIMDVIENTTGFTKGNVRKQITNIPETIDDAYEKILDRSSNRAKAKKLLHIVTAATRPLSLKEMSLALAIEVNHKSNEEVEDELEKEDRFRTTVRDLCGLFVVIIDSKIFLLHQTAKEFLVQGKSSTLSTDFSHPISQSIPLKWKHSLIPTHSSRILAEVCISYLNLPVFKSFPKDQGDDPMHNLRTIFFEYSAENWISHFREIHAKSEEPIVQLALRICRIENECCKRWLKTNILSKNVRWKFSSSVTVASIFGLEAIVKLLLEEDADVDSKDSGGRTPLSWAAERGYEAVVKLLLEKDTDVDSKDSGGRTPLWWAARRGHKTVVKLLLEKDADVDCKDSGGRTPLSWAAGNGREVVVKLLLQKGADIDSKDSDGQTPLSWAEMWAGPGHKAVVELLRAYGA